jgi:stearoyl-CoA desaturase (delta-9 desaturase)
MNQTLARTAQIYILILSIIAVALGHWSLLALSLFFGWILQGISLETLVHRKYAHTQFRYKNILWELVCYVILLSTSLGRPFEWSFGHRVHHRYTDEPNDPQSPHSIGKLKTFFSIFPAGVKGWDGIAEDLKREKRLMVFNKYYYHFYVLYNIIWFAIDPTLAVYFIGIPSLITWLSLGTINTLAHTDKYEPKDLPFPLLFWGGNYHGTHHKYPRQTWLGPRDLSGYVIKIIGITNDQ